MTYDLASCDPASASHHRSYDVGYGKPPHHTRFQKGQSGNPGGRPRGTGTRVKQLALDEAYREVAIDEDGEARMMPAIQAVIRAQLALAAKGNGPAQRAVLKMVQEIETERAAIDAEEAARLAEAARRIAYLRRLAEQEARYEKQRQAAEAGARAPGASGARPGAGKVASAPTAGSSDQAANCATHTARTDEAVTLEAASSPSPLVGEGRGRGSGGCGTRVPNTPTPTPDPSPPSGRLRPSSTGYGGGEQKECPAECDCPATREKKEKALPSDAATVPQRKPQEKDETTRGPQARSAHHGSAQHSSAQDSRRMPPPQTQRRDSAYDRLPWPERFSVEDGRKRPDGVEDGRKRPDGGSGRFRAIEPPAADEVARPRGAPICDYPGASRNKRQSQRRGASP